jgi:hypothetical protein
MMTSTDKQQGLYERASNKLRNRRETLAARMKDATTGLQGGNPAGSTAKGTTDPAWNTDANERGAK